jgi:hypothetical protein
VNRRRSSGVSGGSSGNGVRHLFITDGNQRPTSAVEGGMMKRCLTPFLLLLAVLGCSSPGASQGATEGRAAAERDIAAGSPCLLFIGMPSPDHSPLDPSTGLLHYSTGCVVSDRSSAFVKANNELVLRALREGRLAGMTCESQALTAEEARAFFADGRGTVIAVDGVAEEPVENGFRVEMAPRLGRSGDTPYVFVVDGETGRRTELIYVGEPKARVAFAHGGRTVLVRDDAHGTIRTFDLARGLELQVFPDAVR